ncbi:MAG: GTPase HflX [Gammaproteobacteria bacterium]
MFERPRHGERAILVYAGLGGPSSQDDIEELERLAVSAGAELVGRLTTVRKSPDPRFFIGSGKVEELRASIAEQSADLVIFDHELSPSQERNLERAISCRVLDRTGLILDIFAQRARSFEGKLQVELAQLKHLSTRLVRGWTHLERQKGGIGLRGPGETQLETDRRLLGQRIKTLTQRLQRVDRQREQGRRTRRRADVPTVSLVGYTNAGKSTLFNSLTESDVYAADQLFATLDPTLRRLSLGPGLDVVLADTVGFVRDLPHDLVAAFRSTLKETREAALLLHVVDAADPERDERMAQVNRVLAEIGAEDVPQLLVFNKVDLTGDAPAVVRDDLGRPRSVWMSAATAEGMDLLVDALLDLFGRGQVAGRVHLDASEGRARSKLYDAGIVTAESEDGEGGWDLDIEAPRATFARLCREAGLEPGRLHGHSCDPAGASLKSRSVA